MSRNPPAFQFYADDFLAACVHLTCEEVGVYIRLLCFQWTKGSVPDDLQRLERITGAPSAQIQPVLDEYFDRTAAGWQNGRLEQVRQVQRDRAAAGRKGGQQANAKQTPSKAEANGKQTPKQNGSKSQANGVAKSYPPSPSPSPSPSSSSSPTSSPVDIDSDQMQFDEALRLEQEIYRRLEPRTAGDRLLAWRCAVLVTQNYYSQDWLFDSLEGVKQCTTKPKKPWGYLTTCLKTHADAQRRDFDADCKQVPPRPRARKRPPPDLPTARMQRIT